jgi:adenylyltransferase/sulfurtransferase
VLVVGAGGLGCPVLTSLATAGVGHIHIADFDRISISNIHRQPLYSPDAVGEKKVAIAKARIQALNPFIQVQGLDKKVAADNVEELIQKQDLILDCTDNLETKFLLHDACFKHRVPLISASIYQFEGQVRTFIPTRGNGCLRCVLPKTPDDSKLGNCNDFGVLGASVGAIGSIQANEAILFLLSGTNTTADSTFYFNLRDLSQMRVKNFKHEGCETCAGSVDIKDDGLEVELNDLSGDFEVVDIREREDSYLNDWRESGKKIVVCCYRGVRSKRLVKELRAQGLNHFYSLRGGACSL